MSNKKLTLSIVIPAYNEQRYLKACLDSIAMQIEMPDEVFVVDNNSTDNTAGLAKSYSFVTLLHEPNQHQSFAQATGFNAATSDILGRIDADSILPLDWTRNVKRYFSQQPKTVGITGGTFPYDLSSAKIGSWGFRFYINLASKIAGGRMLWGANCALRRSAWQKVNGQIMTRGDIWEDYDLSFCLARCGELSFVECMDIDSSFRAVHKSLITQTRYQFRAVRTFYLRRGFWRAAVFFGVWISLALLFIPLMIDKYLLVPLVQGLRTPKRVPVKSTDIVRFEVE